MPFMELLWHFMAAVVIQSFESVQVMQMVLLQFIMLLVVDPTKF